MTISKILEIYRGSFLQEMAIETQELSTSSAFCEDWVLEFFEVLEDS